MVDSLPRLLTVSVIASELGETPTWHEPGWDEELRIMREPEPAYCAAGDPIPF